MRRYIYNRHVESVSKLYDDLVSEHGDSLVTVQRPRDRQDLIFSVLLENVNLDKFSILDVGCGVGHLVEYIQNKNKNNFMYTGIDVSSKMIDLCRKKFKSENVDFINGDLSSIKFVDNFDYVVFSGTFNNNPLNIENEKYYSIIEYNIERMFELCSRVVSFNLASTYVDYYRRETFHSSPERIFSFAKELSKRVSMRHDYLPFEFTVHIYKDDSISDNNVFNAWEGNINENCPNLRR